jgi:hypothetical protein
MWIEGSWLLHYDNAPAYTVLSIRQLLVKHAILTRPQSPYSPDLFPPALLLFLKFEITLKEKKNLRQQNTSSLMQ